MEGIDKIEVSPCFATSLTYASAHFDAPKGRVEVSWKREADKIALFVTLPEGMSGTIRLPSGYYFEDGNVDRIAESGEYTILYK